MTPSISLFHCSSEAVRNTHGLGTRLRVCGIGHLEAPLMLSRADLDWCKDEGWRLILIGDGVMRTDGDRERYLCESIVCPQAAMIRDSGIVDGVEMVDEVKQDPREYPGAELFVKWWRSEGGSAIAWPGHAPQRWEVPELSDYDSRQWLWEKCLNDDMRLERVRASLSRASGATRPLGALVDITGPDYIKQVPGHRYRRGKDRLNNRGRIHPTPENIRAQLELAKSMGATRFRLYAHDYLWERERVTAPIGTRCQTGMGQADRRWPGFLRVVEEFTREWRAAA